MKVTNSQFIVCFLYYVPPSRVFGAGSGIVRESRERVLLLKIRKPR